MSREIVFKVSKDCTDMTQRKRYLDAWLATSSQTPTHREIDAIICPVTPFPPPPHGQYVYAGYTCVWNVLDLPSVSILTAIVDEDLDAADPGLYTPRNEIDLQVHDMYDGPQKFKDTPIGIQVVG